MHQPVQAVARHAAFDWAASALGAREGWPYALRLTVDILLNTPQPMLLLWGPERVMVYNDAYVALAGARHPAAPGAIVPPIWPPPLAAARASYEGALQGQAAPAQRHTLTFVDQDGVRQRDCELAFTPIDDGAGQVLGVLCMLGACGTAAPLADADAGLRILVVEDNLDAQYLVCEMLRALGHEADGVGHAEAALSALGSVNYQVLFSDVSLPGMSGVELARKAISQQPALQVIFASGYGDALLKHLTFPYLSLQKPYDLEQLQSALATIEQRLRRAP
jgi:CheY-like chemotaxis protein